MLASLQLENFVVESLHVRCNVDGVTSDTHDRSQSFHIDIRPGVRRAEGTNHFLVTLQVRLNHRQEAFDRFGFSVDLILLGFFSFASDVDEKTMRQMISLNGPSILYGVARGIVAQALALTEVGKIVLPSINFTEVMTQGDLQRRQRKERPDRAARGPSSGSRPNQA
jgi:preprotein translocase subunit SecB